MRIFTAVLIVLVLNACGSDDSSSHGFAKKQGGDANAIPPGCGIFDSLGADDLEPSKLNLQDDERWLPLHELYFRENQKTVDLCELFRSNSADLVILQFTSLPCYRCMKWIENIATGLAAEDEAERFQHVVLAQPRSGESADEWQTVQSDVAQSARWIRDYQNGLWNFFSLEGQTHSDPVAVVFNRDARGFFTQDTALDFLALKSKIDKVLQIAP